MARQGKARHGRVWHGLLGAQAQIHGQARLGWEWHGQARLGQAGRG